MTRIAIACLITALFAEAAQRGAVAQDAPLKKDVAARADDRKSDALEEDDEPDPLAPELARAVFAAIDGVIGEMNVVVANDNFEQQFKPTLEPIMKSELYFLRSICKPNAEQYQELKKAGDKALTNAISKLAAAQRQAMRGNQQQRSQPDPHTLISDSLEAAARKLLPEANVAAYLVELEKRKLHRKRTTVQLLVFKLDRELLLNPEQRKQITASLTEKYDASWEMYLGQNYAFNEEYVAQPPEDRVAPFLTETQKAIFRANKSNNQNVFFGWGGNFLGVAIEPDAFLNEP